jgi:hypothetical protein
LEGLGKWRGEAQLSDFFRVIRLGTREEGVRMGSSSHFGGFIQKLGHQEQVRNPYPEVVKKT